MNNNTFLLLHLADSALPIGSFAFSNGLESAVKHGFINNNTALQDYFVSYAEQIISFDFPFIYSSYQAAAEVSDVPFQQVASAYEVMLLSPPLLKAGRVLGKNWIKLCGQVIGGPALHELLDRLLQLNVPTDLPVVFGCSARVMQFALDETLHLYFYMSLRDQLGALIRLGVAGPSHSHALLRLILKQFTERISDYFPVAYTEAYKVSYLLELAQLSHHKVYSKLFQN